MADVLYAAGTPLDNDNVWSEHRLPHVEVELAPHFDRLIVCHLAPATAWPLCRPLIWVNELGLVTAAVCWAAIAVIHHNITERTDCRVLWIEDALPATLNIELAATTL
jgi:hypothetical protein